MIFVTGCQRERFTWAILCDEFLNSIWGPHIEEAEEGHHCEPMCGRVQITCTIVSMESEHAANYETPLYGLIGNLKLKEWFQLERVVALLLRGVIFKVILIRCLKILDVFPAELVNLSHFLWVCLGPFVEVVRRFILLPPRWPLGGWVAGDLWASVRLIQRASSPVSRHYDD